MKKKIFLLIAAGALVLQNCQTPINKQALCQKIIDSTKVAMDKNKAVLNQQIEVINSHDLSKLDEFVAPDCKMNTLPPEMQGLEGAKKFISNMITAFPDFHIEVQKETEIAEGDMVSHRVVISGTNQRPFMGMAPTGKKINWNTVHTVKIADGKIKEFWIDADRLGMMQQLGAVSPPAATINKTTASLSLR